ncbi:MAG: hypothetical protein ACRDLB_07240 [Actinomycetota bacterium]
MCDRTNDSPAAPTNVVRARRFELVDDSGQVRAVLGDLATDPDAYWPGLTLRSASVRDRVWLMVHNLGVELAFDLGGNIVAVLGVLDPGTETPVPGVSLTVCNADGVPVFGWHVNAEGNVEFLGPTS